MAYSTAPPLNASDWPYSVEYVNRCERVMERLLVRPEWRQTMMHNLIAAGVGPLEELWAIEEKGRWMTAQ